MSRLHEKGYTPPAPVAYRTPPGKGDAYEGPADSPDVSPIEDPWIAPLAVEAFHGLAGDIVRTLEPHSEADPAALLVQSLVMFGNSIARTAHFTVEGDNHYANEFAVLVGPTASGRKGTSFGRIQTVMAEADSEWANDRITSGLSSAEGCLMAVRDAVMTREKVNQGRGQAPEYHEVESDPGIADKRLMLVEPEWAGVLKQAERSGNTLSPVLRQFWDGKAIVRTLTKNSPIKVTGGHVSIIGHITPEELRRYMTTTECANGFANRHLFALTRRSKYLPRGSQVPASELRRLQDAVRDARDFAADVQAVGMTDAAWKLWDGLYPHLTADRPGLSGALLARGAPHVRRLAMIYALMDRNYQVEVDHLAAAGAVWHYCESGVEHVFGNSTGDPLADEIAGLLKAAGPDGKSRTEITDYFGRNQPAAKIGQALGLLERYGRARRVTVATGGRPAERWTCGPTN